MFARNVTVGRLRMCATGYCSALHGIPSNNLLILEAMDSIGDNFPTKDEGDTEHPLYYHMHVGAITFYLSLTLCGQLSSSNQSALFIPRTCHLYSLSLLTLVSLRMT